MCIKYNDKIYISYEESKIMECHYMAEILQIVLHKISLFSKMQGGRSPSFELFQLDIYVNIESDILWSYILLLPM